MQTAHSRERNAPFFIDLQTDLHLLCRLLIPYLLRFAHKRFKERQGLWTICRKHFRMPLHREVKRMFRIVETFNNAVVAASAVQYHAGGEILHTLMVAAVDANLLTAHNVSGECPGDQIHPMSRDGIVLRLRMNILRNMIVDAISCTSVPPAATFIT